MSWLDTLEEIRKKDWSKVPPEERETKSREVVTMCAYGAAASSVATSLVPVPFVDLALLIPVHVTMVMTVGTIHDRKLSKAEAKRVVLELGTIAGVTFAGRAAVSALRSLLPGIAGLVAVSANFALTWALGRVSIEYFANPKLSREDLKKIFASAMEEGKKTFSKEAFDKFREKNKDAKPPEPVVEEEEEPEVEQAAPPPPKEAPKTPPKKKRTL